MTDSPFWNVTPGAGRIPVLALKDTTTVAWTVVFADGVDAASLRDLISDPTDEQPIT